MPDYPEVIYWLALINESGLKLSLAKPIVQRWCLSEKRSLADLFDLSPLEWSTRFGLSEAEAERAVTAGDKLAGQAAALAEWQGQGIEPIIRIDSRYPKRLAYVLPPAKQPLILWAQGALNLLNEPGVAMLGSQAPDEATAKFISELMNTLVAEDIGLVSGYGRGLDRATFEAMLATENGHAVAVLPMGLRAFAKTTAKLASVVEARRIALVSPFVPDTPFQEKLAEARNLLIDHLALALLIPQTDVASQERGSAALGRGLSVFVGLTDTTGNRALIDQGALLLTDAGEVVEMVQQAMVDTALLEEQANDEAEAALPVAPPLVSTPSASLDPDDDYALRLEEVEPIGGDEALDILSMGGQVPEVLRQRLKKPPHEEQAAE